MVSQLSFLLLFFFLFINTDYSGSDTIEYAVNLLFRIDPLLALTTMLAVRTVIALMLPALLIVVLSLLLGRSFCGWICPLGSLVDGVQPAVRNRRRRLATLFPHLAASLLVIVLVSAVLGLPLAGYIDPFSILVRGLAQAVYPATHNLAESFFTMTYESAPPSVNLVTEPLYSFLKETVLPFERKYFDLSLLSLAVLATIFLVELFQRRFFCRNVCPLGALLGWFARLGPTGLNGGNDGCGACRLCSRVCRMGAIDEQRRINPQQCSLCMDCLVLCPRQIIAFRQTVPGSRGVGLSLSRRRLVGVLALGCVVPPILGVRRLTAAPDPQLIRPPGALAEEEFLQRCVRCAECIQVCIGNGLQPALLEAGIEGIFSPRLVARTGYCEFNCTLCGQVCPTGAIRKLTLPEKHRTKIGNAWFDKDRCLPFAKMIPCIVCEEHCPTPDKAIKFSTVTAIDRETGEEVVVRQPSIVDELCIGCGICETKCPLPGRAAVFVTSDGEMRDPDNRLPDGSGAEAGGY
ncbi:MAG: 4Fe-4S binding protein [Desulfofustis sp.]|nr:4Fe-4S binding protein [Desulfofustis sp.]